MKINTAQQLYIKALATRRAKIVELRKQRYTWTAIGKLFGISRQRAQQLGSKK